MASPSQTELPRFDRSVSFYGADEAREDSEWLNIDSDLLDWLNPVNPLVDVGAIPPSHHVIRTARRWIVMLRQENCPPPDMVVPDNAGGLAFEWNRPRDFWTLNIARDGSAKILLFRDGQFAKQLL
jgi:hypothetical protein